MGEFIYTTKIHIQKKVKESETARRIVCISLNDWWEVNEVGTKDLKKPC